MPKSPPLTTVDLLLRARRISPEQFGKASELAAAANVSVDSILYREGIISAEDLRTVSLALTLLTERRVPEDIAIEAIARTVDENINLEEALVNLGWRLDYRMVIGRLCQILIESGYISQSELSAAIQASNATGLPLGRVLVVKRVVSEPQAYAALTAQVLIKEGKITSQAAIDALRLAREERVTLQEALIRLNITKRERAEPIRLGQLLISAGILTEMDLLSAVEKGMAEEIQLGQVLLNQGLISQTVLDRSLALQKNVNDESMTPAEAIYELQNLFDRQKTDHEPVQTIMSEDSYADEIELPESVKVFGIYTKDDWFKTVQQLTLEKQNLAYKVVNQQEEMKFRLARDMHDTVIADLMMLKRYLDGDKELSKADIGEIVDHVVRQLRDICSDFAPRNFKEWGLEMTVKDMLNRMGERTGIRVDFVCEVDMPHLPEAVGLHIFRIIQEGINNIEKYSGASAVTLLVEKPKRKLLRFTLSDNGKGLETAERIKEPRTDGGGMGLGGMKERADLIRCFYPTTLKMDSIPGQGVTIQLELEISE